MSRSVFAVVALVATLAACSEAPAPAATGHAAVAYDEASYVAKREADIPDDSMGASIRRGLYLMRFTPESLPQYATSGLRCTSCHQDDGIKLSAGSLAGVHARFPQYMTRTGAVIDLSDRINYCFTRSLAGNSLPKESREMEDLLAYMAFISQGVPTGYHMSTAAMPKMPTELEGDPERGRQLYVEKTCSTCHGANGEGMGPLPPLWGPKSYSIGASMARIERAAAFIYRNMPQVNPGSLTEQEAWDLAAYINGQPRPDSPAKEEDWPVGGNPKDVPYDLRSGHRAYKPPPLLPRATPDRAVVPVPPRAASIRGTR
ncbi:MAG TPA: c-type cytochrome [Gemmatimonadaceae bacterium]|jgi:thiosulfate dehydrogenase|nr:c-type cytochrome [Gemmatimonadaceae bacterium]HRQ78220.1 c-type cytochrome [Gemmatimonadaceae bacterium]